MNENGEIKNNSIWIALAYILVCLLIIVIMFANKYGLIFNRENEGLVEEALDAGGMQDQFTAAAMFEKDAISKEEDDSYLTKNIEWDKYIGINSDVYAWIYVPGTKIDYPVLQSKSYDDFYLNHNLDLTEGFPGCIYSQKSYNGLDFTDSNTILYGHNMKDGTMFTGLHNYEDKEFFSQNRYFYIYMPDGKINKYKIFASYNYEDVLIPEMFDFTTDSGYSIYLDTIKNYRSKKMNRDDALSNALTTRHKIVTLSTCIGLDKEHRYLVQGVLQN